MRVIGWGGEPATGKSDLMLSIIPHLGRGTPFQFGLVRGASFHRGAILVLGLYDGKPYPGTDRLSMACEPQARELIAQLATGRIHAEAVLFEGDRLFNGGFLSYCVEKVENTTFFVLECSEAVKTSRRTHRADTKDTRFLKGRESKYKNILRRFDFVRRTIHETRADRDRVRQAILGLLPVEASA